MRYGMVIDTRACMGCNTCVVKCKQSNNLPNGILWNRIETCGGDGPDTASGTFPDCSMSFYPVACQHCENPVCAKVCPTRSTRKDERTGIVIVDQDLCIGCKSCMMACPYDVRMYQDGQPQYYLDVRLGEPSVPDHQANVVQKCTLCYERVSEGLEPACIAACPGRARIFGDFDDADSEVSKLIAENEYEQLFTEAGTKPNVYYLV